MPITHTTTDTIEVGYIDDVDGYVKHVSVADANEYAKSNSDTAFIFIDGSGKTRYLSIDQVNALTPNDLRRPESCDSSPKPISSPTINIFGGSGVGAEGNPIIDTSGNIIAVDIVNDGEIIRDAQKVASNIIAHDNNLLKSSNEKIRKRFFQEYQEMLNMVNIT